MIPRSILKAKDMILQNLIEWQALFLSFKVAMISTILLTIFCIPIAWGLYRLPRIISLWLEILISLPIVLPPSVIGFYLLLAYSPNSPIGRWYESIFGSSLAFSFVGIVLGSCLYSLPFVMQPILQAYRRVPIQSLQLAANLGANSMDRFISVVIPSARNGILTGFILGFSHVLGEFGVVLMVGGNIPGETRLVSMAIYDHVEQLNYSLAHRLSLVLIVIAFVSIYLSQLLSPKEESFHELP